ncbi:MAG: T9SS type A sorting domain-containing protein [Bacteroidia bacterium]
MKKNFLFWISALIFSQTLNAQTSWKGVTSTAWATATNWTAGVPLATTDVIIGDSCFTGAFQPLITATATCKSLTVGSGSIVSTLTISKAITVAGNFVIGSNGTVVHNTVAVIISVKGDWINSGTYSSTLSTPSVTFYGVSQNIIGATTFRGVLINAGCTVTLASNITIDNTLSVSGTLDPTEVYIVSGTATLTVNSGGTIKVKATNFSDNYTLTGAVTLNGAGYVNYASALIDQNISNAFTYGYLRISGGMTKYLTGNLLPLASAATTSGRIYIDAGTLDLQTYTADRGTTTVNGYVIMAGTAKLKIGGNNGFPANYVTLTIPATCTVEYYGNDQIVKAATYGNLTLSSSSGVAVKTMPVTSFTIAGDLTCDAGAGTGVTFTAGNIITVNKNITFNTGTIFNAATFSHAFKGNLVNNGTINGNTSIITLSGINATLTGTGAFDFYSLSFSGTGMTAPGTVNISVAGNLSTSTTGVFTHSSPGTVTMTGTTKTISGAGLKLFNLVISGTATLSAVMTISGDFTVNGTFTASSSTVTMDGASKTINGSGTITFFAVNITGTISTSNSFSTLSTITIALTGSFTATAGTATIAGSGTLNGTVNLYNITISSAKTLTLGANAVLVIANIFTKTGTLTVTTVPNTVIYNAPGAQTVVSASYNNLILANSGTKTAAGVITVNNDFTINTGVTFAASTFTFTLYRHFTNSGTFTQGTSIVQLLGANAANITGAITFYTLTVNKSSALVWVTLQNNVTTGTLTMTLGNIQTGSNSITITTTRTGAGLIMGTITHSHAFTNAVAYSFEGAQNLITFTTPSVSLNSVTVTVTSASVVGFTAGQECINRDYVITIPAGTYTNATLKLHYENSELNAFNEPNLTQYHYNTGTLVWDSIGITTRDTAANWVAKTLITNCTGRWTLSGFRNVVSWNGSVSSAWETAANWTTISGVSMANRVPVSTDEAQIGQAAFTYNPVINSARIVNILMFGSTQAATLTIASGSLTTLGAISGTWSAAASHTLDVSSGALNVTTNLDLSDGTNGHDILLKIGTGSAIISNNLTQWATGGINFTGNGSLTIGGNFIRTAGSFTPGTGTIFYTGGAAQTVAAVTYNNLSFTKSTARATINFPAVINGNLTTATGGELAIANTLTAAGDITIGPGTNLLEMGNVINIGGNWTNNGTFTLDTGTVNFNGSGNQTVSTNTFNNLKINKAGGTLSLTGDLLINRDLTVVSGIFDLSTYLADRSSPGGILTVGALATLKLAGANNFPENYDTDTLSAISTVEYNGTIAQNVNDLDYGNLVFSNGGATAKTVDGDVRINGDLLINPGATVNADSSNITMYGNFTNNGTYNSATNTVILNGISKNLSGANTFYNLQAISGSYTVAVGSTSIAGNLLIDTAGSLNFTGTDVILDGDLTNKGSLTSNGAATFTGTRLQTIRLINSISSSSTGVINFNGTVSPVLNSTSSPAFATVNINNTAGITASAPWSVYIACNIAAGATFDGGTLTHTFYGNFTNNGAVASSGELNFTPMAPFSSASTIKLDGVAFTSTGLVEFGGSVPITIIDNNPSFDMLFVSNSNAAGITPPTGWNISNLMYIAPGATFNGGASLSHTFAGNLTNNGTFNGETSTINLTGNAIIGGSITPTFYNLTIAGGANIGLSKAIDISKDFTDNGIFNPTGRRVKFTGSTSSTISGTTSPLILDDMEQSKTAATTILSVPVNVTGSLTMTDGIINTTASNILSLNDNAIVTAGSGTSFVNGPMKKTGNEAFIFPIGKSGYFHPVSISAPISATDEYLAEYFPSDPNVSYGDSLKDPSIHHISGCEYWFLNRTNGTSDVNVALSWDANSCGVNYLPNLTVAQWNGSMWKDFGNGGTTGTTSSGTIITSAPVTTYGPFTLGGHDVNNPLPISLLSFTANPNGNHVDIRWATLSEINNDFFIIEKSSNGLTFEEVTKVNGAGNSNQVLKYMATDENPFTGRSYYRLKQTDFNGMFKYSNMVTVTMKNSFDYSIFPNPTEGTNTFINIYGTKDEKVSVIVYDNIGREIFSKSTVSDHSGACTIAIEPAHGLVTGLYSVIIKSGQNLSSGKLIVN